MSKPICKKCGGTIHGADCLICEMLAEGAVPGGDRTTTYPMESVSLAVHPRQVEAARARAKRHGISVQYDNKGTAILPDAGNRRKLLRLEGFRDNQSFY